LTKPFKTLTYARDVIRQLKNTSGLPEGGVVVYVRSGDYDFLDGPFTLQGEQDSGKEGSPIVYRSFPSDSAAHLTAGVGVTAGVTTPVKDENIKRILAKKARDSIVQVDLKKLGISDYGELESGQLGDCANNKLELFFPDKPMVLARYPNISPEGEWQFMKVSSVTDPQKSFHFTDSKIAQWKNTSTLWLHGFWSYDWADNYVKVDMVNTTGMSFVINSSTPPVYDFKPSARYYALNILEELDSPNEYYVDRGSGIMYLYTSSSQTKGCVSVGQSVISLEKVSYVQFEGFVVDCARQTAITASDVSYVHIVNMTVKHNGGSSVEVSGYNNTVQDVIVMGNGWGGMAL